MTYDVIGAGALNYTPCRYGNSRVLFRGPQRRLDAPFVAFLGGTETYGKFIKAPFPALVESSIGVNCVNFGVANAGVDVFLNEEAMLDAARGSTANVLQIVGAQNISNRFYAVHPRRNDRFVKASGLLTSIYPEVDFSEFHFTRHMLGTLYRTSPERFAVVRGELQTAWMARMQLLLKKIGRDTLLLWFSDHAPLEEWDQEVCPDVCSDPLFVTREMIDDLRVDFSGYVEVTASHPALKAGTQGMVFSELEAPAARKLLGPRAHEEAAKAISDALGRCI